MPLDPPVLLLEGGSAFLRPLDERDVEAIERALDDTEIRRWFDNSDVTVQDVLERAALGWERSDAANFAILDDGRCVGSIWLNVGPNSRSSAGYWLLAEARGKGLATRALVLVARWAFAELGLKRVGLMTDPRNKSSRRVAERAGFKKEGILRSWTDVNGERVDHVSYSLLPSDVSFE